MAGTSPAMTEFVFFSLRQGALPACLESGRFGALLDGATNNFPPLAVISTQSPDLRPSCDSIHFGTTTPCTSPSFRIFVFIASPRVRGAPAKLAQAGWP